CSNCCGSSCEVVNPNARVRRHCSRACREGRCTFIRQHAVACGRGLAAFLRCSSRLAATRGCELMSTLFVHHFSDDQVTT
ncbi:unnamed protein product, partial [Ectocarpus sp. 8 AP-2014]